jgi:hypothetical protein
MTRLRAFLLALLIALLPAPLSAKVLISFHSFNGSVVFGRYPHGFVVMEGTLEATGQSVSGNYGFTAKSVTPAILSGPVKHAVEAEAEKYVKSTNRHFSVEVDDATYARVMHEIAAWRDAPGKYYDLNNRNCVHFIGRIAELLGLKVAYPKDYIKRPKAFLNQIVLDNPQLGRTPIK